MTSVYQVQVATCFDGVALTVVKPISASTDALRTGGMEDGQLVVDKWEFRTLESFRHQLEDRAFRRLNGLRLVEDATSDYWRYGGSCARPVGMWQSQVVAVD